MSNDENSQKTASFLSGRLTQVDVAGIEKELRGLWKQAAGDAADEVGNVVRACSFNLILFSADDHAEQVGGDLLDAILTHHPCRAILAIHRPDKSSELEAWVSARCHLVGAMKQICSEQITVRSEGPGVHELPSVVLPLLIPDLPVFLWWRDRKIDNKVVEPFKGCSRRFVTDTGMAPFDSSFLRDLARLALENPHCLHASDLNWRRIEGWRRRLADAFDGFPLPLDYLFQLEELTLITNGKSPEQEVAGTQAILIGSWLASRLCWQPDASLAGGVSLKSSDREVKLLFETGNFPDLDNGSLGAVKCVFTDGKTLSVDVLKSGSNSFLAASTKATSGDPLQEAEPIDLNVEEEILVGQELEILTGDPVYLETMTLVERLLPLLTGSRVS